MRVRVQGAPVSAGRAEPTFTFDLFPITFFLPGRADNRRYERRSF